MNSKQFMLLKLAALARYRKNNIEPKVASILFNNTIGSGLYEVPGVLKDTGRFLFANPVAGAPAAVITNLLTKGKDKVKDYSAADLSAKLMGHLADKRTLSDLADRMKSKITGGNIPITKSEETTRRLAAEIYRRRGRNPADPIRDLAPFRKATPMPPNAVPLPHPIKPTPAGIQPSKALGYTALAATAGIPLGAWYLASRKSKKDKQRGGVDMNSLPANVRNYYFS